VTKPQGVIRPATACDVQRIHEVERACFSDPWSTGLFAGLLAGEESGMARVFVADVEGRVLGFIVAERADPEVHITNVAVHEECRRTGIARRLLDAALSWARSLGLEEAWLEVRESNAAARGLYREFGFVVANRRRAYYRHPTEDALVMVLVLHRGATLPEPLVAASLAGGA
jgi:ribosomal-protein-alanine N-acetyltransferase